MQKSFNSTWEKIHEKRLKDNCLWGGYPCEVVIRFMARNYYSAADRKNIKVCDMGCGSGANTWYLCNEGFDVYGFDGSESAIEQAKIVMNEHRYNPSLKIADALNTGYEDEMFDVVIDNVSMCYMLESKLKLLYQEAYRITKAGAKMFTSGFTINTHGVKGGEYLEKGTYTHIKEGNVSSFDNILHVWESIEHVKNFFADTGWDIKSLDTVAWTDYNGEIANEKYIIYLQK